MNKIFSRVVSFNSSGLSGCLISSILMGIFLGSIGLGWLVNGTLIFVGLILFLPVLTWFGFNLWLRQSLVESSCPVCSYEFTAFLNKECVCPNCGEPLLIEKDKFRRLKSLGTIDVIAIDVVDK